MQFREAVPADIPGMHRVRMSVKENVLNTPSLVTEAHYLHYITEGGKGWVCEHKGAIAGFAIVDVKEKNIWALFVDPSCERKGIGKMLQKHMLAWYFSTYAETLWLGTAPFTRAERFYRISGWEAKGIMTNGELRFEMSFERYKKSL